MPQVKIVWKNWDGESALAGTTLEGTVRVKLEKETKCKALYVQVSGCANVTFYQFGRTLNYIERYLDEKVFLFKHQEPVKMPAGIHSYDFTYAIPFAIPRTNDEIRYTVFANLDVPWSFFNWSTNFLKIKRIDNMNSYPILREPRMKTNIKSLSNSCFGSEKKLIVSAFLPHSGVVPGQIIRIKVRLENYSNVRVEGVEIMLKGTRTQRCVQRHLKMQSTFNVIKKLFEGAQKEETKEIFCDFLIPADTDQSDFLFSEASTLRHSLVVKAVTSGIFNSNPKIFFPIVIGSVAITDNLEELNGVAIYESSEMRAHMLTTKY